MTSGTWCRWQFRLICMHTRSGKCIQASVDACKGCSAKLLIHFGEARRGNGTVLAIPFNLLVREKFLRLSFGEQYSANAMAETRKKAMPP